MKAIYKNIIPAAALVLTLGMSSCSDILEISPKDPDVVTNIQATQLFNKCYANIAVAGQGGANGDSDIDGLDGGTTGYVRQLFNVLRTAAVMAASASRVASSPTCSTSWGSTPMALAAA